LLSSKVRPTKAFILDLEETSHAFFRDLIPKMGRVTNVNPVDIICAKEGYSRHKKLSALQQMIKTTHFEQSSTDLYQPMFKMMVKAGECHKRTEDHLVVNGKLIGGKPRPRLIMVPDESNKGFMIPY